jgi:hypothetical protein
MVSACAIRPLFRTQEGIPVSGQAFLTLAVAFEAFVALSTRSSRCDSSWHGLRIQHAPMWLRSEAGDEDRFIPMGPTDRRIRVRHRYDEESFRVIRQEFAAEKLRMRNEP